jgi:hypothetical protein
MSGGVIETMEGGLCFTKPPKSKAAIERQRLLVEAHHFRLCFEDSERQRKALIPEVIALRAANERLREALFREVQYHDHECNAWRMGKSYRPCTCEMLDRATKTVEAIATGTRRKRGKNKRKRARA